MRIAPHDIPHARARPAGAAGSAPTEPAGVHRAPLRQRAGAAGSAPTAWAGIIAPLGLVERRRSVAGGDACAPPQGTPARTHWPTLAAARLSRWPRRRLCTLESCSLAPGLDW